MKVDNDMVDQIDPQSKQRFASEVLWHFVGRNKAGDESYALLKNILKTGLKVGKDNEPFLYINAATKKQEKTYGYQVSCLADIPLKDLHIHAERYGKFAIGFHKKSVVLNEFNPVLYINQFSRFFQDYMRTRDDVSNYLEKNNMAVFQKFEKLLQYIGSYAKSGFLNMNLMRGSEWDLIQLNNYYYEREWRSIKDWDFTEADVAMIILPEDYLDRFIDEKHRESLRIMKKTPVLGFDMIRAL